MITFPERAQGYGYTVMGTLSRAVAAQPMGKYDTPVVVITAEEYSGLKGQLASAVLERDALRLGHERITAQLDRIERQNAALAAAITKQEESA